MYKILILPLFFITTTLWAQSHSVSAIPTDAYQAPLDFELLLAGNYGELRANHFHAGLDFKTQGVIGHPVRAFADGYVSRIGINAHGYGLVAYVRHPQFNITTVYAHLSAFSDSLLVKIRARQVSEEVNNANLTFAPDELPVHKGDIIAKSGNTGSSGGPHVHFEVRDCNDEDDSFYDPLPLFRDKIKDTQPPRILRLYLYPLGGVSNSKTMTAWGRIGVGVKAYDYMDGQVNHYGVKDVKLFLEDSLIYHFREEEFRHSERRYTNSVTDYRAWVQQRAMIMKSFIEPGNHLRMLDFSLGDGTVVIDEERTYRFRYELTDGHDNKCVRDFTVRGVRQALPKPAEIKGRLYVPGHDLSIDTLGCRLHLPDNALYNEFDLVVRRSASTEPNRPCVSPVYSLGKASVPVHAFYDLSLPIPQEILDTLTQPRQLFIANLDGGVIGGKYEKGRMQARVREFGRFAIRYDRSKPTIGIVQMTWNMSRITVGDTGSGVARYKVWIDDKFVPFDMDNRGRLIGRPRYYGIERNKTHKVRIWAVDMCGNETVLETKRLF